MPDKFDAEFVIFADPRDGNAHVGHERIYEYTAEEDGVELESPDLDHPRLREVMQMTIMETKQRLPSQVKLTRAIAYIYMSPTEAKFREYVIINDREPVPVKFKAVILGVDTRERSRWIGREITIAEYGGHDVNYLLSELNREWPMIREETRHREEVITRGYIREIGTPMGLRLGLREGGVEVIGNMAPMSFFRTDESDCKSPTGLGGQKWYPGKMLGRTAPEEKPSSEWSKKY